MESEFILRMLLFSVGSLSVLMAILVGRRGWFTNLPHVAILAALAAAALALYFLRVTSPLAIASVLSGSVLFNVLPLVAAGIARRRMQADRFGDAANILLLRFPLAPSLASLLEIRVLQAFAASTTGGFEEAVRIFEAIEKSGWFERLRHQIDEAYLDLCFKLFRWQEAGSYLDENPGRMEKSFLRNPRLMVFVLRVRCETGRLAAAAALLTRIAEATPSRFTWGELASAYMILLGSAGEVEKLQELYDDHGGLLEGFPPPILEIWMGRARARGGDAEGAQRLMERARDSARATSPDILRRIEKQMDLGDPVESRESLDVPWPPPFPRDLKYVSAQAFTAPRSRPALATGGLILVLVAVWGLEELRGGSMDNYVLTSMGANARFLIDAGQYWRFGSSTLLHFGVFHLVLNVLGLLILGRIVENAYGAARFLVIYVLSGFAGSAASHLFSDAPLSAGASGAIFGLVGAGIAFLVFHGSRLPPQARRTYLLLFLFIAGADTLLSVSELIIDTTAHLGGLALGFVSGAALKPVLGGGPPLATWKRIGAVAGAVLSVFVLALCAVRASIDEFGSKPFPRDIPYAEFVHPDGGFGLPVPSHFLHVESGEDFTRFLGAPGIEARVELVPRQPWEPLDERALSIEEENTSPKESSGSPPEGSIWSGGGSRRHVLVLKSVIGVGEVRRSFYFEWGDSLARIAFTSSPRGLEAYEDVMSRMVSGFRFAGERRNE